jgi:hypothetical protein
MNARIVMACVLGTLLLTSCRTLTGDNLSHIPASAFAAMDPKLRGTADGCWRNLGNLGIAGFIYADEHNGRLPANWQEYKDCLEDDSSWGGPQLLVCPSQGAAPTNWNNLNTNMISYQMVAPGWAHTNVNSGLVVYIYCPEHHSCLMADGSIRTVKSINNFIWLNRVAAPNTALEPTPTAP